MATGGGPMETAAPSSGSFRFGPFVFDPRSGDLRGGGIVCRLSDQPLALLIALVEQPGRLVTREELRQRLWPDGTFVDYEHGLNSAVSRLREALGDSAGTPRFVETIPRRGYRLRVPVDADGGEIASATSQEPAARPALEDAPATERARVMSSRRSRGIWVAGAAALLTGALAWLVVGTRAGTPSGSPPIRLLTVTSLPGSEGGPPSLSPDGNFVAFAWTARTSAPTGTCG